MFRTMGDGTQDEIRKLVVAAQAGDKAAFGVLVGRFRRTIELITRGVCRDEGIAEDAAQDAFVTAFRAIGNLEEPSRFGPWLATIARNRAIRLCQDQTRTRSIPLSVLERDTLRAFQAPVLPLAGEGEAAIRDLPKGIFESMDLYYLQDWSVGEIAALLERPVTTVKWQLHAGRALLRKRLGPDSIAN